MIHFFLNNPLFHYHMPRATILHALPISPFCYQFYCKSYWPNPHYLISFFLPSLNFTQIKVLYLALWCRTAKNTDCTTGPLACSLALLTRLLAPDCSLHSRPPLRSLARSRPPLRSLARFTHSLARGKVNDWMAI